MHQSKGETEDETLRKLETFNWNRKPTVTVIIDDSETTHLTNKDNSSVVKANTNYSQDTRRRKNESNTQSSEHQSLHLQITNISQPNSDINMQRPPIQRNEVVQESFDIMSHNLILILRKFESVTQSASNYHEYVEFKKNIFTLLKSMVSNIVVPRHKDPNFVTSFLHKTVNIGLSSYNYYISYLRLETLFWEMVTLAKQQNIIQNETENEQSNNQQNITVSSFFSEPVTNISNNKTSQNAKRRKTSQEAKGKAKKKINDNQAYQDSINSLWGSLKGAYFGKHYNNYSNDQINIEQQAAMSRGPPPPYPRGLSEVTMSPTSLDGDNDRDIRQLEGIDVPELNPSISFVTSLNPERTPVTEGHCRICNSVTNRICLGCSKNNTITYYCSQKCQEREWPSHMFDCWKSI